MGKVLSLRARELVCALGLGIFANFERAQPLERSVRDEAPDWPARVRDTSPMGSRSQKKRQKTKTLQANPRKSLKLVQTCEYAKTAYSPIQGSSTNEKEMLICLQGLTGSEYICISFQEFMSKFSS